MKNRKEKGIQPYDCQKLEHDGQVIDWVLMPKASQIYSHRCCESVFDPDGVVEVCCLLWSINLVSLRDIKTIGLMQDKVVGRHIEKHYYKHGLYAGSVFA